MPQRKQAWLSFSASTLLLLASCAQSQKAVIETTANETVVSSTPPFQTKEPERYRAIRTITSVTAAGETTVMKNRIARDGELRRDETETDAQKVIYLNLPEGRFVLLPEETLFADLSAAEPAEIDESESSPDRLLHTDPIKTEYQHIGDETIGGRNAQKYRVVVNSSPAANVSVSETVIWIDETLRMPVKSETKAANGARSVMELSEISFDVDHSLFRIPDNYKKIAFTELRKLLK